MVLVAHQSVDSYNYPSDDGAALPVRTAHGSVPAPVSPELAKVGAPIPSALPQIRPPKTPASKQQPTVYPGGRVVWREPRPLSLDEARAGRRADMSNLFDVSSLHQEELQRVSQLMERQPLSNPMHKPPKTVPPISPQVLSLAGLDVPYDHLEQQAALALHLPPSPSRPRTQARRGGGVAALSNGAADDGGYIAAAPTEAILAATETTQGGGGASLSPGGVRISGIVRSPSVVGGGSRHPPKPASRADVLQLQAVLEQRLHEAEGRMGEQIRAWDDAFIEVVRQVGLHCTERGALLDEIRARYNDVSRPLSPFLSPSLSCSFSLSLSRSQTASLSIPAARARSTPFPWLSTCPLADARSLSHTHCARQWLSRLVLGISELHGAKEGRTALAQEEAATQEDRLQELLLANQSLQHKMSVLRRELEWSKKANAIGGGGADHSAAEKAWKGVKGLVGGLGLLGGLSAKATAGGGAAGSGGLMGDMDAKLGTLMSLVQDVSDDMEPQHIAALLRAAIDGAPPAKGGGGGLSKEAKAARQDEVLAAIVEYLPVDAQFDMGADMMCSFNADGLREVAKRMGEDEDGLMSLAELQRRACELLPAKEKAAAASELLSALSAEERKAVFASFGASAETNGAGETTAQRAAKAAKARASLLATEGESDEEGARGKAASSISKRRERRRSAARVDEAAQGSNGPTAEERALAAAAIEQNEEESELVHSVGGVLSMADMLRKKHVVTRELSRQEVLDIIGGALAMKVETDAAARISGRKRLHLRDELWRYLCARNERRTEALQMLYNLDAALEVMGSGKAASAPNRITAFRHLTGLRVAAGGVWPNVQSDFYVLALQAIFPQWAKQGRQVYTRALAQEDLMVPIEQAVDALKYLCRDVIILHRLHARVKGAAAEAVLRSSSKVEGVGLDWFMQVLMQAWEDSQLACQKALQSIFFEADDNGDGILQLEEFYAMIRERKPDMTDAEAFVVYDEALALSEQMLGYESDAILADAFTRTAIGHNLFSEIAQPLKTADEAGDDPPPGWGLAKSKGGKGGKASGSTAGGGGVASEGGGATLDMMKGGKRGIAASASVPALPGILGGNGARPPLVAGMASAGAKGSNSGAGKSSRASIGSPQGGGLPMLG